MQVLQNQVTYAISEFADKVGLSAPTIRYYERENLLKAHRNKINRRYFTDEDVQWVKFLLHLKGTGMSIHDLKNYVAWRSQGDETIPNRLALLKDTRETFIKKLAEVQHHLQILDDKINWYEEKTTRHQTTNESFSAYLEKLGHHE